MLFKRGDQKTCSIYHPIKGKIAESVMSANRMFILHGETSGKTKEERCLQIDSSNKAELWHHQYGHLSHNGLTTLRKKEMVTGLPDFDHKEVTCKVCIKGKQHRVPFPRQGKWRSTEKLHSFTLICVDRSIHHPMAIRGT